MTCFRPLFSFHLKPRRMKFDLSIHRSSVVAHGWLRARDGPPAVPAAPPPPAARMLLHSLDSVHCCSLCRQKTRSVSTYMHQQSDINARMRAILVDWLVEVHFKLDMVPQTLYLAVHIIDKFCMGHAIPRSQLQLIGVSSLLIASKYEEIYPPEVLGVVPCPSARHSQASCSFSTTEGACGGVTYF